MPGLLHYFRHACIATVFVVYILPASPAQAQESVADTFESLRLAFNEGQVEQILEDAADQLDVTLPGANAMYSRSQTTYILENFFKQYPPQRFVLQSPSEAAGNWFVTGTYWTSISDLPYSVYLRLVKHRSIWALREIRIDIQSTD